MCIPPSVPACSRTTYCPIEACTFDACPFPSRRVVGSRTILTKYCNNARVAPRSEESLQFCRFHNMPLYTNMMQHSVPSTATTSVSGSIQHRMQIPWRSTTECCRSDGGGWQTISWGCSSCDTSARILATFCWVHKPSSSRILSMLPSPAAQSRIDAWQCNWD